MPRTAAILLAALSLAAPLLLAACVPAAEAPPNARLSQDADAPGYLIVGFAEQNYRWGLVTSTQSIALTLTSPGREPTLATRKGCGSMAGFVGTRPCDLSTLDRIVLRLTPGTYTLDEVALAFQSTNGPQTLRNHITPPIPIRIAANEIVDAGDFTFASDAEKQEIRLVQHTHGDAQARSALATFPNLRAAPIIYRGDGGR